VWVVEILGAIVLEGPTQGVLTDDLVLGISKEVERQIPNKCDFQGWKTRRGSGGTRKISFSEQSSP